MKVLILCEYPPTPGGLSTQGDLLYRGLSELGVAVHAVHLESAQEKEWYYRWFKPDVVVGVGYWGHTPHLVLHPQRFGMRPIPWLVANGYVGNFQEALQALPLVLVTSNWVRDVYARDGVSTDNFVVLPVGCDTDAFVPRDRDDPKVVAVRQSLGVRPDELMLLTVGGDAASKGAQEVMQALAMIKRDAPSFKYVCKVWPQERTSKQNIEDLELAQQLGIEKDVVFTTSINSRNFLPYLIAACDIYAGPSRLEGFGMPQIEAGACGKPVLGIRAMALLDTLVHEETALLADVASEVWIKEALVGIDQGFESSRRIVFPQPRAADYRASVHNIAEHLLTLMNDGALRNRMGQAARQRVKENYDYRVVARRFIEETEKALGKLD